MFDEVSCALVSYLRVSYMFESVVDRALMYLCGEVVFGRYTSLVREEVVHSSKLILLN